MKVRSVVALVGLAISFALPTFAQQKDPPVDPKLTEQLIALSKRFDDAYNNNDAAAVAELFTKDGVMVTDSGPIYGPEAIEKYQAEAFKQGHFSNYIAKADQYGAHMIGTDGKQVWRNGEWSQTWQGKTGDPIPLKGYWSCIEVLDTDGVWKYRMLTWNVTPAPTK
jgi:ketosteroid isomerase-like protein